MRTSLPTLRYYLEIIALPAFVFLVIHLTGHGFMVLWKTGHGHQDHQESLTELSWSVSDILEFVLSIEFLSGIAFLLLFAWLWSLPILKKWVPCTHEHCHTELSTPHILASAAFCLHFFPEAGVRNILFQNAFSGEVINILGFIAFAAHFLVDILITIILSNYFTTTRAKGISIGIIAFVWMLAFFAGEHLTEYIPVSTEGIIFLISGFLLAMFIHKPHRPIIKCSSC